MSKTLRTSSMILGALTLAVAGLSSTAQAQAPETEKCYGVVKAGKNDCGSPASGHSCAGHAKADSSGHEWIKLPKGTCEKLTGGSLTPAK